MNSSKLVPVQRKNCPVSVQYSLNLKVYKDNVRSSEVTKQPPSTASKREQELLANIQLGEELNRLQASQSVPSQPVTQYLDNSRNQRNKDNVANQVVEPKSPLNSVVPAASEREQKEPQSDIKKAPAFAHQDALMDKEPAEKLPFPIEKPAKILPDVPYKELLKPQADIKEAPASQAPDNQNAAAIDKEQIKQIQAVEPSKISEKEPSKLLPIETKSPLNSMKVASDKEQKEPQADIKEVPALANQEPAKVLPDVPDREPELLKPHADIGEAPASQAPDNQNAAAIDKEQIKQIQAVEPSKISEKEPSKLLPIETKSPLDPVSVVSDREQVEPQAIIKETPVSPTPANKDDAAATDKEPAKILEPQTAASLTITYPAAASKDEKQGEHVLAGKEDQSKVVHTTDRDTVAIKEVPVSPTAAKKDDTAPREKEPVDSLTKDITNQSTTKVTSVPQSFSPKIKKLATFYYRNQNQSKWRCILDQSFYIVIPLKLLNNRKAIIYSLDARAGLSLLIDESKCFILDKRNLFFYANCKETALNLLFQNEADAKEFFECIKFYLELNKSLNEQTDDNVTNESLARYSFILPTQVDELTQQISVKLSTNDFEATLKAYATFHVLEADEWKILYAGDFEIVVINELQALIVATFKKKIIMRLAIELNRNFKLEYNEVFWNDLSENEQSRKIEFLDEDEAIEFYLHLNFILRNQRNKANLTVVDSSLSPSSSKKAAKFWSKELRGINEQKWVMLYEGIFEVTEFNDLQGIIFSLNMNKIVVSVTIEKYRDFFRRHNSIIWELDSKNNGKASKLEFQNEGDAKEFFKCINVYLRKLQDHKIDSPLPVASSKEQVIIQAATNKATLSSTTAIKDDAASTDKEPDKQLMLVKPLNPQASVASSNNKEITRIMRKKAKYWTVAESDELRWEGGDEGYFEVLPLPLLNNTKADIYSSDKYGRTAFSLQVYAREWLLEKETLLFYEKDKKPSKKLVFQNEADAKEFFECINFYLELDKSRNKQNEDNATNESLARYSFVLPTPIDELTRNLNVRLSKNDIKQITKRYGVFWALKGDKWTFIHKGTFQVVKVNDDETMIMTTYNRKIAMRLLIEKNRNFICHFREIFWNDLAENKRSRKIEFENENYATMFYLNLCIYMDKENRSSVHNALKPKSVKKYAMFWILQVGDDNRGRWERYHEGCFEVRTINDFQGIVWAYKNNGKIAMYDKIEEYREFFRSCNEISWKSEETKQSRILEFRNERDAKEFFECIDFYLKKSIDQRTIVDNKSKQVVSDQSYANQQTCSLTTPSIDAPSNTYQQTGSFTTPLIDAPSNTNNANQQASVLLSFQDNPADSFRLASVVDELTQQIIDSYENNPLARVTQKSATFCVLKNGKWVDVHLNMFEIVQLDDLQAVIWAKDRDNRIVIRVVIEETRNFFCKHRFIYWNSQKDKQQTRQLEFQRSVDALDFYLQLSVYLCNQRKKANQYIGVEKLVLVWRTDRESDPMAQLYTSNYVVIPLNKSQVVICPKNYKENLSDTIVVEKWSDFALTNSVLTFYKVDSVIKRLLFDNENDAREFYECILNYVPEWRKKHNQIPTASEINTTEAPVVDSQRIPAIRSIVKKKAAYWNLIPDNMKWVCEHEGIFEVLPLLLLNNMAAIIYSSDKYGRTAFSLPIDEENIFVLEKTNLLFDENKYKKNSKRLVFQDEADAKEFFGWINFCLNESLNEQNDDNLRNKSLAHYSFIPTPEDELTQTISAKLLINASISRRYGIFRILEMNGEWKILYAGHFEIVKINQSQAVIVATFKQKIIMMWAIELNRNFICHEKAVFWNDLTENKRSRKIEFSTPLDAIKFYLNLIDFLLNQRNNKPTGINTLMPKNSQKHVTYCKLDKKWENCYVGALHVTALNDFQGIVWAMEEDEIVIVAVVMIDRGFALYNKEIRWNIATNGFRKFLFRNESDAREFFECIDFYLKKWNDHRAIVDNKSKQVTSDQGSANQQLAPSIYVPSNTNNANQQATALSCFQDNPADSFRLSTILDDLTQKIIDSYENNPFARVIKKSATFSVLKSGKWVVVYDGMFEIVQLDDLQAVIWAKDRDNRIVIRTAIEESRAYHDESNPSHRRNQIFWRSHNGNEDTRALTFKNEKDTSDFKTCLNFYIYSQSNKGYLEHRNRFPLVKRAEFNNVDVEVSIKMYRNPMKLLYLLQIGEIHQILTLDMNFRANDNCRLLTWNGFDPTTKEVGQFELNFRTLEERNGFYGIIMETSTHIFNYRNTKHKFYPDENNPIFTADCHKTHFIRGTDDQVVALAYVDNVLRMLVFDQKSYKKAKYDITNMHFNVNSIISANSKFMINENTISWIDEKEMRIALNRKSDVKQFHYIVSNHVLELNEKRRMF